MNRTVQWLVWALAVVVVVGVALAGVYLVILSVIWIFLEPFTGMLKVLAIGLC